MSAVLEKGLAIIGASDAAARYSDALLDLPELRLDAIVDPDTTPAPLLNIPVFPDVRTMLERHVVPDVAIVCSPPAAHADAAEPLLLAGVDLLLEPPVATTPSDAAQISALAEHLDRIATTAARFRSHALLERAVGHLSEGCIGELRRIEVYFSAKRNARRDWHSDPALAGGGVLMEFGPDALDVVELLAGPIQRIRMLADARLQGSEVEDWVALETGHGGDLIASIELTWNVPVSRPIARCFGDAGELSIGWAQTVLHPAEGDERVLGPGFDELDACRKVLEGFLRARLSGPRSCDRGAETLDWLHAAYRSREERRWQVG